MKDTVKWLAVAFLLLVVGVIQADPFKDNALDDYRAAWYPNFDRTELMTCPQACV